MTYNGLCPTAVYWLFKGIMTVNDHALHFRQWPPLDPIKSFIFYIPACGQHRILWLCHNSLPPWYKAQLQATLTHNSTWLMVIAFFETAAEDSFFPPLPLLSRLSKTLYLQCMKRSVRWLDFADDIWRLAGLFWRGGCGKRETNLEGIKRLLCVRMNRENIEEKAFETQTRCVSRSVCMYVNQVFI